jgi:hypothetical protein
LPKAAVLYPFWRRISARVVISRGRMPLLPGKAVAVSMIDPALLE